MPSQPRWGYQTEPMNLLPIPLPEADMTHQEFIADIKDSVHLQPKRWRDTTKLESALRRDERRRMGVPNADTD